MSRAAAPAVRLLQLVAVAVGVGQGQGPYEDLQGFLHHADELAESLLSEGTTASWADSDGDGLSNAGEFIHGTRPADGAHRAALEPEIYLAQGVPQVRLRYPYNPQADLLATRLEKSSDGQVWTALTPTATPDGTGYTVRHDWSAPLSTLGAKTFFRFKYLVP